MVSGLRRPEIFTAKILGKLFQNSKILWLTVFSHSVVNCQVFGHFQFYLRKSQNNRNLVFTLLSLQLITKSSQLDLNYHGNCKKVKIEMMDYNVTDLFFVFSFCGDSWLVDFTCNFFSIQAHVTFEQHRRY